MSKPVNQDSTLSYYYNAATQLLSNAKNYLNSGVTQMQSYGNSVQDYASTKMDQISHFGERAKAFYNVIDRTAFMSYKGAMIGLLSGLATGGVIGGVLYMQYGSSLGALYGFFDGLNTFADTVIASAQN